ncbi:MAG: hypothetical protein JXR96_21460 [Deltaproteobacteria bacterium]|nr:hypothetical protein [Deltaproteobacteria bacterium]
MRTSLLLIVVVIGLAIGGYYLLQPEPAFDLERFHEQVDRLKAGYRLSSKVGDIDAVPAWVKREAEQIRELASFLAGQLDADCARSAAQIEQMHAAFEAELAAMPGRLSAREIADLAPDKRQQLAHKIVYALFPAYEALAPQVDAWAHACPEESIALERVLGTGTGVSP